MITPIKNIMTTQLVSIPLGTSLLQADQLMKEKRIRHLPVVDSKGVIVGVLSRRDFKVVPDLENTTVDRLMNSPVQFVSHETPLRTAIFQMLESKISCLLISDEKQNAVGIVTTDDLLWYLSHLLDQEKEEAPSFLSASQKQTIGEVANKLSLMGI